MKDFARWMERDRHGNHLSKGSLRSGWFWCSGKQVYFVVFMLIAPSVNVIELRLELGDLNVRPFMLISLCMKCYIIIN